MVAGENPRSPALNDNLVLEHSPGLPLKLKDLLRHVNSVLKSKAVKQKDVYSTFKHFCPRSVFFSCYAKRQIHKFCVCFFLLTPRQNLTSFSCGTQDNEYPHFLVAFCLLLSRHTVVFSLVFLP